MSLTDVFTDPALAWRQDTTRSADRAVWLTAPDELTAIDGDWRELLAEAIEPNPCFTPGLTRHLFAHSRRLVTPGVVTVRAAEAGRAGPLIGLLPLGRRLQPWPGGPAVFTALHSPFSSLTAPLIRRGAERPAIGSLLDWLSANTGRFGLLTFNEFRLDGPVWAALRDALDQRGQPWLIADEIERPLIDLAAAETGDAYLARLAGKTRQTLRRKWRQLEKLGSLTYETFTGDDLPSAMRAMALDVFAGEDAGTTRVEALCLDGRPIAMSIHVGGGDSAVHFKPAYDERYASASPGRLLYMKSVEGLYRDRWATSLDSAVRPDSQLGSIWRERRRVGTLLIGTAPGTPRRLLAASSAVLHGFGSARGVLGRARRELNSAGAAGTR